MGNRTTNRFKQMCADRIASSSGGGTFFNYARWSAMGTGATSASRTAASSDTALSVEVETRASGSVSLVTSSSGGPSNDTYQNVGTITATASRAVDEYTLNDTSSSGGSAADVSATLNVIQLLTNDSIQLQVAC